MKCFNCRCRHMTWFHSHFFEHKKIDFNLWAFWLQVNCLCLYRHIYVSFMAQDRCISSDFIRFVLEFTRFFFHFVLPTGARVCLYRVLGISQVESEQIILWAPIQKKKLYICIQMYIITFIPNFHEFAFTLCCMCCALKAHNKQQANECIDSIFWVKNTAQKEKEKKKKRINPLPFALTYSKSLLFLWVLCSIYECIFLFLSCFFWLGTNLIWGWKV